jgi:hypothetical protein
VASNGGSSAPVPSQSSSATATPAPQKADAPAAVADAEASIEDEVTVKAIARMNAALAAAAAGADGSDDVATMLSSGHRFGEVAGFATAQKLRRDLRRQALSVQAIGEFIVIDPEHNPAQLAQITARAASAQTAAAESSGAEEQAGQQQQQQQTIAAASISRNFATESTSTRSINILAAVAAGASVMAARYQRWRKRRLAEAAAARLASMLQFDPLAAWLDDDRHRRN